MGNDVYVYSDISLSLFGSPPVLLLFVAVTSLLDRNVLRYHATVCRFTFIQHCASILFILV